MDHVRLKACILRIRQSDRAAFDELFLFFQQDVFNFLLYQTQDEMLAEDLLQEVFLQLWESRADLNEEYSIKSYLFTMARNKFLNHVRHQNVVAAHVGEVRLTGMSTSNQTPEGDLVEKEFRDLLINAINEMPDMMRTVFLMNRVDGLPAKEIAERLSISTRTVESHIYKAIRYIYGRLPKEYAVQKNK